MPLYMHKDMYKTGDNFGYSCSLPNVDGGDGNGSVSIQAFTSLVIGLLAVAAHINI